MNILVIGNGFDLAHGLPTKYTDFLDWVNDIFLLTGDYWWQESYLGKKVLKYINTYLDKQDFFVKNTDAFYAFRYSVHLKERIAILIRDNFWLLYFLESKKLLKESWVDFEYEILNVIQIIQKLIENNNQEKIEKIPSNFFKGYFDDLEKENNINIIR